MMKIKSLIKKCLVFLFRIIGKEYLVEYWILAKNESTLLADINYFYQDFITPGMKVIDVGGNIGNYSKVFLNLGAKVIAIEPQKHCQKILLKRFKNQINFTLVSAALGATKTMAVIHQSTSHTIASMNANWINSVKGSDRFPNEKWDKSEKVPVLTLDEIIKENFIPDYIKIDVEGFELEVLKGLNSLIKYVSFEITLPEMTPSAIDCIHELERVGKYLYTIPSENKLIQINDWKTKDEIVSLLKELDTSGRKVSADIFARAFS